MYVRGWKHQMTPSVDRLEDILMSSSQSKLSGLMYLILPKKRTNQDPSPRVHVSCRESRDSDTSHQPIRGQHWSRLTNQRAGQQE